MKRIICVLVVCVTLCLAFGATAFAADEKSARLGVIMGDNVCLRAKASTGERAISVRSTRGTTSSSSARWKVL